MYAYPIKAEAIQPVPVRHEAEPRIAVLLNANAKRVSEKVRRLLTHVVPEEDLFITSTFEQAREVAELVVERRYSTVFTGGGDGTFVGFVNEIFNVLERRRAGNPYASQKPPRFGVLKLGTGNSLAGVCGSSSLRGGAIMDDVLRARANEVPGVVKLDLALVEGKRTPFAGVGLDAAILNHYIDVKRAARATPLANLFAGGLGYAAAIAGRTIPAMALSPRPNIEIRSRGAAYRVGPDGKPVGSMFGPGAVLYRGPMLIAAVSTIPCYGFDFRLFPYAGTRRGMMQLRVADLGIPDILMNLYPKLWEGRWYNEDIKDFMVEDIELSADRKVPFQIGGDAQGYRDHVRFGMWKGSLELLDFNTARPV